MNEISNMLDSGFRRNDGFGCISDFFSNLLKLRIGAQGAPYGIFEMASSAVSQKYLGEAKQHG